MRDVEANPWKILSRLERTYDVHSVEKAAVLPFGITAAFLYDRFNPYLLVRILSRFFSMQTNPDTSARLRYKPHIPSWNPSDSEAWYGQSPASWHSHTA